MAEAKRAAIVYSTIAEEVSFSRPQIRQIYITEVLC